MRSANWLYEKELWDQGYQRVCGIDEVGRGAWAGPVVSAAVIFSPHPAFPEDLFDSKMIPASRREVLSHLILEQALSVSLGIVGLSEINRLGIGKAAQMSFRQAVKKLSVKADFHLIDAFYIKHLNKKLQLPIIKGDQISASIAAASIVAKVARDHLMRELHLEFPQYGFDKHKGYGTRTHQQRIREHGFSSVHRTSFDLGYLYPQPIGGDSARS